MSLVKSVWIGMWVVFAMVVLGGFGYGAYKVLLSPLWVIRIVAGSTLVIVLVCMWEIIKWVWYLIKGEAG